LRLADIRLRLAHEIGHLVYNINLLPDSKKVDALNIRSIDMVPPEEELFAWRFAYELIKTKSEQYHNELYKEYEITDEKLEKIVLSLTENDQNLNAELKNYFRQKPTTN